MQLVETAAAAPLPPRTGTLSRARRAFWSGPAHRRCWRLDPRRFGRAQPVRTAQPPSAIAPLPIAPATPIGSALGLFAITFLAGFLFVSILLA